MVFKIIIVSRSRLHEMKNHSRAVERSMRMQNRRLSVSSSILAFPPPFCSKFRERRSLPLDKYTNARNWPARAVNACTVLEERGRTRDIKLSPNKSPWAPLLSVACFSLYHLPFVPSSSKKLGPLPPYPWPCALITTVHRSLFEDWQIQRPQGK